MNAKHSPLINKDLDKIFEPFSQQSDDKGITLTWSSKDSITEAKQQIIDLINREVVAAYQTGARHEPIEVDGQFILSGCNNNRLKVTKAMQDRIAELNQRKADRE